jgi:UDP-2,4-diacetamido-2,4,6-trideoxy-beta-L-altropyranose hydrolase
MQAPVSLKPLLIRADAGPGIGAGHAMRCLSLTEEWTARGGAVLFFGDVPAPLAGKLRRAGAELRSADELSAAPKGGWCVVDGYRFGVDVQSGLRGAGHHVLCIDDYAQIGAYAADAILDQNVAASEDDYPAGARRLCGSRYVLLRREFRGRSSSGAAGRVLVTMGGNDVANVSLRVAQAALRAGAAVRVMLSATHPAREAIASAGADVVVDPPSVVEHMEWCTLAVTASGTSAWELAALGVPSLQLFVAENQRRNTLRLAELGICSSLGAPGALSDEALTRAVGALLADRQARSQMAERGRALIDGQGAARVCDVLIG